MTSERWTACVWGQVREDFWKEGESESGRGWSSTTLTCTEGGRHDGASLHHGFPNLKGGNEANQTVLLYRQMG